MNRSSRLILIAAVMVAVLLGVAIYMRSWGGVALVLTAAAGFAWYRVQVARGEASEQFFGDAGEETRLTSFQAGSPSEMPIDRNTRPAGLSADDDQRR